MKYILLALVLAVSSCTVYTGQRPSQPTRAVVTNPAHQPVHNTHQNCKWVPGHYNYHIKKIWIPGHWNRTRYGNKWIPGRHKNLQRQRWVAGHYRCR